MKNGTQPPPLATEIASLFDGHRARLRIIDNYLAPHAMSRSADRRNGMRECAEKILSEKARAKIETLQAKRAALIAECDALCDLAAIDREEVAVHENEELSGEDVIKKLEEVRVRRAEIPAVRSRFLSKVTKLSLQTLPEATAVLRGTLERVVQEIRDFSPGTTAGFWGISADVESGNWFVLPMRKLADHLVSDIYELSERNSSVGLGQWELRAAELVQSTLADCGAATATATATSPG